MFRTQNVAFASFLKSGPIIEYYSEISVGMLARVYPCISIFLLAFLVLFRFGANYN